MIRNHSSLAGALLAFSTGLLQAAPITVPNASFESPATSFVSINIDSWQKTDKPDDYVESGGFLWTQLTGIFRNTPTNSSDHIDNCDGNQALWLFAVPQVGLFQDYDSIDWRNLPPTHQFNATFTPGKSYHLTVGVIGSGGGMLEGATLDLILYYRDAATNQVPVAVTTLTNTPSLFSNTTHLVDCRVDVPPVKATDAWAGQHVGILFKSTVSTNLQGGYWDLDNVRLSETVGPALLNPFWTNGQFAFTLLGEPGTVFQILAATNALIPTSNWVNLGNITNTTGSTLFTDTPSGQSHRFYQAVALANGRFMKAW
jgi:hypothetical protein